MDPVLPWGWGVHGDSHIPSDHEGEAEEEMKGYWKRTKPEDFEVGDFMDAFAGGRGNPEECFRVVRVEGDAVTTVDLPKGGGEYTWNSYDELFKWVAEGEKPKMKKIEKDGFYDIWEGQKYIGRDHEKAGVEYGEELTYVLVGDDELPAPPAVVLEDGVYICSDCDDDLDVYEIEGGKWYEFDTGPRERGEDATEYAPYTPVKRVRFEDV
jgi:hypothetical protein